LDIDRNGRLSKKELLRLNNGTLTEAFVDRIFAIHPTKGGEMVFFMLNSLITVGLPRIYGTYACHALQKDRG
jgi:hypothetical protein